MLNNAKKIFIVGVGGIGTSGLARILKAQGKEVSGSDALANELTEALQREGIEVHIGHKSDNLSADCELLIYSAAVPDDNRERQQAVKLDIPQLSYPQAVGELLKAYDKVIAVAGTNGKTTTAAMIAWSLEQAGYDPTALIGSIVTAWKSNVRVGGRQLFVLEADEYRRAFLNYHADVVVITNIAADHLDYFKDLEDVKKAFAEFAAKVKPGGILIENYNIENFQLKVPGKFNQANASAAAAACRALGIGESAIKKALKSFTGTWRRFELVGKIGRVEIFSDYAHHPAGIAAILEMIEEEYPRKKVLIVFQPHQHNRTKKLFVDFVKSFCESRLEDFILAEIFDVTGREESRDQDVSSKDLVQELKQCGKRVEYVASLKQCEAVVRSMTSKYEMIVFMGAGDIYKVADKFISN